MDELIHVVVRELQWWLVAQDPSDAPRHFRRGPPLLGFREFISSTLLQGQGCELARGSAPHGSSARPARRGEAPPPAPPSSSAGLGVHTARPTRRRKVCRSLPSGAGVCVCHSVPRASTRGKDRPSLAYCYCYPNPASLHLHLRSCLSSAAAYTRRATVREAAARSCGRWMVRAEHSTVAKRDERRAVALAAPGSSGGVVICDLAGAWRWQRTFWAT